MPEKIVQAAAEWRDAVALAILFAVVGMIFTVGQLLMSKEALTARIVIGRCISTAGLSMAAGLVLLIFPGAPLIAQIGVAAALGALGTSALERMIQRILGPKVEG